MAAFCSQCNSPISPNGECPACLFQLGISQVPAANRMGPQELSLPSIAELSQQFPQLEIRRLIGRGGMGAIYQARQTTLDRDVALKLIAKEVSQDPLFVERFEREAKALAKLSHPNIVTVFDFGRTKDGMAYLIMEFVDGVNLREAIATKSVGSSDALELIARMCQALEYAHSKGVVHRDIKPENILLGEDGSLKIADFGIAKIVDETNRPHTLTATRQVLGSLHYLAPEQIESPEQVDHRVDLYALGVVFYELLTGQLPLGNFEPPSSVVSHLDKRVDAIVLKTLNRKPSLRYQNAQQLHSDIQQARTASEVFATPVDVLHRGQAVSVPFEEQTMGGLATITGLISATGNSLKIEYRISDAIFGSLKSKLNTSDIPVESISNAYLKGGVFGWKITLIANTASAFGKLPDSETGRVQLSVAREDRNLALQVLETIGFPQTGSFTPTLAEQHLVAPAILMFVCGLLNGGFLAMLIVATNSLHGDARTGLQVGLSVLFGTLASMQIACGLIHLISGYHAPLKAAMIASLVPATPIAVFSLPLALWYFYQNSKYAKPQGSTTSATWGATTLAYIRENRTARVLSILNAVGIVLVVGAIGIYWNGLYPIKQRYRIIGDSTENANNAGDAISKRLSDVAKVRVSVENGDRVTLSMWNRDQLRVTEALRFEKGPQMVVIATQDLESDTHSNTIMLELAAGLEINKAQIISSAIGRKIACVGSELNITPSMVSEVNCNGSVLTLSWTQAGRTALNELVASVPGSATIGIVVDDMVQGMAITDEAANQQLRFTLSGALANSAHCLPSAIRGPELPFELELLQ